jgi:transposase
MLLVLIILINPNMGANMNDADSSARLTPQAFFKAPLLPQQRKYEALRAFFLEDMPADAVARQYGYTVMSVYSLIRDFKKELAEGNPEKFFFAAAGRGRPARLDSRKCDQQIVALRKQYLSVPEIRVKLDALGTRLSQSYIWQILRQNGFNRLPRRRARKEAGQEMEKVLEAPVSALLEGDPGNFSTSCGGVLVFLLLMSKYGIDNVLETADFPGTKVIPSANSLLAFIALKLSGFKRYSHDDQWCMDAGLGLFAGLNVLPKTGWLSSYSFRVSHDMNMALLSAMNRLWREHGLAEGPLSMDFTAIPCWGDGSHLENNWSGKRHEAIKSIQAVLAHSPDTGIIFYGDSTVRHSGESRTVLEFLDFRRKAGGPDPTYLVFDSRFTTYQNLNRLNQEGIQFLTIRRRGKNMMAEIASLPEAEWRVVRVESANGFRNLKIHDAKVTLKDYEGEIRQIAITGHGKIKPALIITNDFQTSTALLIRTYTRRWLVEKEIAEQIYFFHLNKPSSSIVVKVDFDLTMSIIAHNLYRLLAMELPGYEQCEAETLFNKFVDNGADVEFGDGKVTVRLKKKRDLPLLLKVSKSMSGKPIPWLGARRLEFIGATST